MGNFISYFPTEVDDNGTTRHLISRVCYKFNSEHINFLRKACKTLQSLRVSSFTLIGVPEYTCYREPLTFNLEPSLKKDPQYIIKLKKATSKFDEESEINQYYNSFPSVEGPFDVE